LDNLNRIVDPRFAEAGDDDEDSEGDDTVEHVIERLREVNHSYLEKSKQASSTDVSAAEFICFNS
jgi:hypothetical protein